MRWQKVRLCCLALVRTTPGAVILRLRRLFLSSSSDKPIHLSTSRKARCEGGSTRCRFYPPPARAALNVPCFEGLSPTSGENSTSPLIRSAVSNLPLNIKVPASRPTLPSINSTAPEKVTEFASPRLHFASEDVAPPQTLVLGSSSSNLPFPSPCASKRRERWSSFAKVISTFHLPIRFGDCAWAMTTVWRINMRIKARFAVILFRNPDSVLGQGFREFRIH